MKAYGFYIPDLDGSVHEANYPKKQHLKQPAVWAFRTCRSVIAAPKPPVDDAPRPLIELGCCGAEFSVSVIGYRVRDLGCKG